jgi:hypothetical protein
LRRQAGRDTGGEQNRGKSQTHPLKVF